MTARSLKIAQSQGEWNTHCTVCCKLLPCACIVLSSNGFSASGHCKEAAPAADGTDAAIATDKQLTQNSAAVAVLQGAAFVLSDSGGTLPVCPSARQPNRIR